MEISTERLIKVYSNLNYAIFDGISDGEPKIKPFDLNIFGIRSSNEVANKFDDFIGVFWRTGNEEWELHYWSATTDPGKYYLNNPMNVNGTAILVPGQYRKSHTIGLHRGQYSALVQRGTVKVFRDRDRDSILDFNPDSTQSGLFGINIHRANAYKKSTTVDKWSAGCQVFADPGNFDEFMDICYEARNIWGGTFTYTLLTEDQLRLAA